jgi:1-acyl-sn-glycerol-3-phosphate acyltransferase
MIRSIWVVFWQVVLTGYFGLIAIIAGLLRIRNRPGGVYDWCARQWGVNVMRATGIRVRTKGFENIPVDQPVVFVSNHQSGFDIFALVGVLPGQVRFVAQKELWKIPVLGGAMRAAQHIAIDRQNRQAAFGAYEEAAKTIQQGMSAVVFAEGTRSRTGDLLPFKKGPFVLAIAAGVPLVPIYCAGTFTLLPKGSLRMTPHPIAVLVGEPIQTSGMAYDDRGALMEQAWNSVNELRIDAASVLD